VEVCALEEGRSWQTFDILMCSVGFTSDRRTVKSSPEIEKLLLEEIRNAYGVQTMLHKGELAALPPCPENEELSTPSLPQKTSEKLDTQIEAVLGLQKQQEEELVSASRQEENAFQDWDGESIQNGDGETSQVTETSFCSKQNMQITEATTICVRNEATTICRATNQNHEDDLFLPLSSRTSALSTVAPVPWRIGEEVLFFPTEQRDELLRGAVTHVHPNGHWVKVEYTDGQGVRELTPFIKEGPRLQRLDAE
jgi:hypothetical protein